MRESTKILLEQVKGWFAGGLRPDEVDFRRARRLVFVCKGNICRSAYAHALARDRGLAVASCGVETTPGHPADPVAQRVAARRGVALELHRTARWIDIEVGADDLVLGMEPWHLSRIGRRVAHAGGQFGLLGLWSAPGRRRIPDPYGRPDASFETCFDTIDAAVDHLAKEIASAKGMA
jgi:protein-tyrosine phosphatase